MGFEKPSSISVSCNKFREYDGCNNTHVYKISDGPENKHGITYINPGLIATNQARGYNQVECSGEFGNCKTSYATTDPRLIHAFTGQMITLDRPPLGYNLTPEEIYSDSRLKEYGKRYDSYDDIKAGQIVYYKDKELDEPFFSPLFANKSRNVSMVYRDPMGAYKPHFERYQLGSTCNTSQEPGRSGLTFVTDTNNHRESIMAGAMAKFNQEKWTTRW